MYRSQLKAHGILFQFLFSLEIFPFWVPLPSYYEHNFISDFEKKEN
jgi:hypothetical protein